jgi:hypothetical protein
MRHPLPGVHAIRVSLLVLFIAVGSLGVAGGAAGASRPMLVRSPFWPSLIADGSVPVGYDLNVESGNPGVVNTSGGRVLARISTSDNLQQLIASGSSAAWVLDHVLDPGSGTFADEVVLGSLSGKPKVRVLTSCAGTDAVAAIEVSALAYGCNSVRVPGSLAFMPVRVVHVMNLASGAKASVNTDGPVVGIKMSGSYLAAAINTTASPYPADWASKEVEVFDLRSMQVVNRVMASNWIQSLAISSSGAVAMTQDPTPPFQSIIDGERLTRRAGAASESSVLHRGVPGAACTHADPLVVAAIGQAPTVMDSSACPTPVSAAGERFVYARIQAAGAALVIADVAGRRTVLRRLGQAHGLLTLHQIATSAHAVLYTDGTCRYSGGDLGVSVFSQDLTDVAAPAAAKPVGCPVTSRLPARVTLPAGRSTWAFNVMIACPQGCNNPAISLDLPGAGAGTVGGGTATGLAPGRHLNIRVRCHYACGARNPPTTLVATVRAPDRTGALITYATRTIHITYCNATKAACHQKLTR